jgi:hypothetical protein
MPFLPFQLHIVILTGKSAIAREKKSIRSIMLNIQCYGFTVKSEISVLRFENVLKKQEMIS